MCYFSRHFEGTLLLASCWEVSWHFISGVLKVICHCFPLLQSRYYFCVWVSVALLWCAWGGILFLIYPPRIFRVVWIWDFMFFIVFGNSQSLFLKYYISPIPLSLNNLLSTYARHSQCLLYFCFQLCCVLHLSDTRCLLYFPPAFYILVDYFSLKPVPRTLKCGCF